MAINFPDNVESTKCTTKTNSQTVSTQHGVVKTTKSTPVKKSGK